MILTGCDFHTRFQQVAMLDRTTGEITEQRLEHEKGTAERFYATLPSPACAGIEATIHAPWFERMLGRYQHELWIGIAAAIRPARQNRRRNHCSRGGLRPRRKALCGDTAQLNFFSFGQRSWRFWFSPRQSQMVKCSSRRE
jgi:hypothetical protein